MIAMQLKGDKDDSGKNGFYYGRDQSGYDDHDDLCRPSSTRMA